MNEVMDHSLIEICCEIPTFTTKSDITEMLPKWQTKVVEINSKEMKLKIKANSVEEIKKWIRAYENHTYTTYAVRSTDKCIGKYVAFKQRLRCHHNTNSTVTYNATAKRSVKNTNCPSKITVTLRSVKAVFKGRDKSKAPDKLMPCEIVLIYEHNHSVQSAAALRFHKVSTEVKEELIRLFKVGHSPTTALETLKTEIQLTSDVEKLNDRKFCPDYFYCYHLYMKEMQKKINPSEDFQNLLIKLVENYNLKMSKVSAKFAHFDSNYVICICPPLFQRIHKHIDSSSEIVFMDSVGSLDSKGCKVFILLTHSDCGALPMAAFIISSDKADISTGFKLLKEIMGNDIFGGHTDGPTVFLTDDSASEKLAVQQIFPKSNHLLCTFYVLQSLMRWLSTAQNAIKREDQLELFYEFKKIMYAKSITECHNNYDTALKNASMYPNYCELLKNYWEKRSLWVLILRAHLCVGDHNTNHFSEAATRILKDKIFQRVRAFNLIQLVDFIMNRFVQYYEKRVLDAANNRLIKNIFGYKIPEPPAEVASKIQIISDSIILVPCEKNLNLTYVVNSEVLLCTCTTGNTGKICKHIYWVCSMSNSTHYLQTTDDLSIREKFYFIATGQDPPKNCLTPLSPKPSLLNVEQNLQTNEVNKITSQENKTLYQDRDWALNDGKDRIEKISNKFLFFLVKDPESVQKALDIMEKKLEKLSTVSSFCSSCATFGLDYFTRQGKKIQVQPPSIQRRKKRLVGKNKCVRRLPTDFVKNETVLTDVEMMPVTQ